MERIIMRVNDADYAQLNGIIKKQTAKYGTQLYHYILVQTFINMITGHELWLCSTDTMYNREKRLLT